MNIKGLSLPVFARWIASLFCCAACALNAAEEKEDALENGERFGMDASYAEVTAIMGQPAKTNLVGGDVVWFYGTSQIKFSEGKMVQWIASDRLIPVFLAEPKEEAPPITIGAATNVVLDAMGTPTSLTRMDLLRQQTWFYGVSSIVFVEGKVTSWKDAWNLKTDPKRIEPHADVAAVETNKTNDIVVKRTDSKPLIFYRPAATAPAANPAASAPQPRANPNNQANSPQRNQMVRGYTRKDGTYVAPHVRTR